jgi:hypothetical protein
LTLQRRHLKLLAKHRPASIPRAGEAKVLLQAFERQYLVILGVLNPSEMQRLT